MCVLGVGWYGMSGWGEVQGLACEKHMLCHLRPLLAPDKMPLKASLLYELGGNSGHSCNSLAHRGADFPGPPGSVWPIQGLPSDA